MLFFSSTVTTCSKVSYEHYTLKFLYKLKFYLSISVPLKHNSQHASNIFRIINDVLSH